MAPKSVVEAPPESQLRVMPMAKGLLVHFTKRTHVAIGDALDSGLTESAM